ncbi:coiled-coil domain-containing protein 174-like isoform X5 [Acropora millepora]|uniref:coiled-coil domain-containing protein 174-like isoform X5 n=1 Tax=Acropora millepora TaxID=45264 RepID=UPI001CF36B82|nr:coiled-coil domain-containing protein 174-like isoform X5 [Acropora millepora]
MSPLVSCRCSGCRMQNNMAAKKVFELNEASIVDLKAELIRKESQLKREKFGEEQKVNRQPKKPPVWAKVKKETKPTNLEAPVQQNELSLEEQQLLETSRFWKLKLHFMIKWHKEKLKEEESQQNSEGLKDEDIPPPSGPHDEWLDYVDLLGRQSRRLHKNLKQLQDKNQDIMNGSQRKIKEI